ncbi:MAG: phosphotransferase family protein, partial [bacterium]|nr:phosphotransferase family protein [bacterium]
MSFIDSTRKVRKGEELDLTRVGDYLRKNVPGLAGELVIEQFPSGHSNLTYLLRLGDTDVVLRRPPFGAKDIKAGHDMHREYRILSKLCTVYPPAPKPLAYCDDDSVMGAPFYVMERKKGIILRKDLPEGMEINPAMMRRLSFSLIDNLAAIHAIDWAAIGLQDIG